MLPKSLCFIDVETSGLNVRYNRIIEIGIVKVVDGEIVKKYSQLINPQSYIDPFVESLTGISAKELENAPTFFEVADELLGIFEDSVFVAHNVRFDYGFIRNEFKNLGIKFTSKHFCTIKLARLLYPNQKRYGLDSIIENFHIKCKNRHRALDDANVIYEFYKHSETNIKKELFSQAVNIALKKPTIPSCLNQKDLENIPETSGVYIFYGDNSVLYIGKSINLKERVMSHFSNDHLSSTDMKISQQIKSFEVIETAGELSALLLESKLIKKHKPLFNRMLRESKKMTVLIKRVNINGYSSVKTEYLENIELEKVDQIIGTFKSKRQLNDYLYSVAKEYRLCPKLLGLDKSIKYCFSFHLNQCSGACNNEEKNLKYNLRFDEAFYKSKVRQWSFDRPLLIKEFGEKSELHVVDKWCYLGSISSEDQNISELIREYKFDLDTYRILSRYILDPKNQKNISPYRGNCN
jgi:DNA polymerase III subunit epsilon